ncbi:MAG: histidinol-phosphate transaminase [Magnetovibrionaceae bacterium]
MAAPRPSRGPSPRPGILEIAPYKGGDASLPGVTRVIKLASNEGPFGPSPKAMAAFSETAAKLHLYPDGGSVQLRKAIAGVYGLEADRIVCGTGSDELLALLARAYAGPGDEVILSEHEFLMYRIAALSAGATPVEVPMVDLCCSVDNILGAVSANTRIVFLANPNNPIGTFVPKAELARLAAGLPEDCLLVIDSAYAEYVERDDYEPGVALVNQYPNVIMTRTFSKIYALGGLRIGWGYGSPEVIDVLDRIRGVFNVTLPGQAAAQAAVEDIEFVERCRDHNRTCRAWFAEALRAFGLTVPPSEGNFVLVRFPDGQAQAAAADETLRKAGIIVRVMKSYGFEDALRISIGPEEDMTLCRDVLATFMGNFMGKSA